MIRVSALVFFIFQTLQAYAGLSLTRSCIQDIYSDDQFNIYMCNAEKFLSDGNYRDAILQFERALSEPVHEGLVFDLYARIAYANLQAGNLEAYSENKQKFILALSLFTGLYECIEKNDGYFLVDLNSRLLQHPNSSEISNLMCFGETSIYLDRSSPGRIAAEARFFRFYNELMDAEKLRSPE